MRWVLAYGPDNIEGFFFWLIVAVVTLLLGLIAVFYAIKDERGRAVILIAPAVIWVVFMTLCFGHVVVKDILKGNIFISEHGLVVYIMDVVRPWFSLVILHFIVVMIVCLVLWFKSREYKKTDE